MLAEAFEKKFEQKNVMTGVSVFRLTPQGCEHSFPISIHPRLKALHFEALFCQTGSITLNRRDGSTVTVRYHEILIISDVSSISGGRINTPINGVLVSIDARNAVGSLRALGAVLGELSLDTAQVRRRMNDCGGCTVIRQKMWSMAVFDRLEHLPSDEWGRYCVIKSAELLYLLCSSDKDDAAAQGSELSRSSVKTLSLIRQYMEAHLSEPLTIEDLSRRFFVSPTTLKESFMTLYGLPVHTWLRARRMERAAEQLSASSLSVLQIAQSVGYSSVSQFSAAFRRLYGLSPGEYRKRV